MSWGVLGLFQIADGSILALKNFCRENAALLYCYRARVEGRKACATKLHAFLIF
jgi:hypothetical protein